ncbi:hypothetical protein ABT174_35065 [Streptomyces sparsogenes]|uniref:hypothetical protein n=1 Tax=Streptomyces sparsogenes TaxID=67365 RepID=UPI00332F4246
MFNESGGLIHYRYGLLLPIPQPNQAYDPKLWGDAYFSVGTSWADVRVKVQFHDGTKWLPAEDWDVNHGSGRYAKKLPQGIQKIHVGRVKRSSSDVVDDNPVGWLLEYVQA